MNIVTERNGNEITIRPEGWLDTASSPELGEEIDKIDSASSIILDFDKIEYIASSGIRQVVACYKKAKEIKSEFTIINVDNEVMSIFSLTGLDKKISIKAK